MKRFLSMILTIVMIVSILPLSVSAENIELFATFSKRTTSPYAPGGNLKGGNISANEKYWRADTNPYIDAGYTPGTCTAYAWGRAYEILGSRPTYSPKAGGGVWDACISAGYKCDQTPSVGAIACWKCSCSGHVAIVEEVYNDSVLFSEGNWSKVNDFCLNTVKFSNINRPTKNHPDRKFQGYVHLLDSQTTPSISQGTVTPPTQKLDKNVYINLSNYPTNGFVPKSFPLKGTIKSDYAIRSITGYIKCLDTGEYISDWSTSVSTKKYNIEGSSLDRAMKFNNIRFSGNYRLRITATNSLGESKAIEKDFSVSGENRYTSEKPSIKITSIEEGQKATITCSDSNAIIHYTVNGGREKTGYKSLSAEFTTAGHYNISAWTTRSGYNDSAVQNKTLSVTKVSTPQISDVTYGKNNAFVTISGNGSINYTTNNSTPSKNSAAYTGPVYLEKTSTVKAIASRYGEQTSSVAKKNISISVPDTPSAKLYNTQTKIAQGKTATVKWSKTDRATSYIAALYHEGEFVDDYETTGTTAVFTLDEAGVYTIKVRAHNFKGDSSESNAVTVESMAPVTITYVDKIVREYEVTDEVVEQIQQNIYAHDGDDAEEIEGNIVAIQKIDYGTTPTSPETPSKKGFTFAEYGEGRYDVATEDKTIDVLYKVNYYDVEFYDTSTNIPSLLGGTQKIMYTMSAEQPTNYSAPSGYIFSGWNIDNSQSTCFDFNYVDGNMKSYTSYSWYNTQLPVYIEFNSIERDDVSYTANLSLKTPQELQNGTDDIVFRLVVALYTSEGRTVYTQVRDEDIKLGKQNNWTVNLEEVDLAYTGKATYASAYAVAVENGKTGGAMSPMATCDHITYEYDENAVSKYWTDWSEWVTEEELDALGITDDEYTIIEEKEQYRYRDAETTTSTTSSRKDGWELYDTDSYRGSWINNGRNYISEVDTDALYREVDDTYHPTTYRTQYRYGRYITTKNNGYTVNTPCPYARLNEGEYPVSWYKEYTPWYDTRNFRWSMSTSSPSSTPEVSCECPYDYREHSHLHINPDMKTNLTQHWYYKWTDGCKIYWWEETREVVDEYSYYTYKYRDTTYKYYFYRYNDSDWSEWSFTPATDNELRDIGTRTVYRYRTASESDVETEDQSEYTLYEENGVLDNVSEDLEGELATVMIYKKTNTDPTEEQIEYVNQIEIGAGNTYEICARTKDKIDAELTGDFIVTLALEGGKRLFNIDYIKAPVPQYKVDFYCNGELYKSKMVDYGAGVDVNEVGIPETPEGQRFVKWDKSVVNITSDLSVNAVTEAETCSVVFVDHENETAEIQEILYGEPIPAPEVEVVEGRIFKGWKMVSDEEIEEAATTETEVTENNTELIATKSMIIVADWDIIEYNVVFYDFEGNAVSEQNVKHGEAAQIPDFVVEGDVAYSWDLTGDEWWNVTHDMTIYPYVPQTVQVDAPTISAPIEDNYGMFVAELESDVENGKIYYVLDEAITEDDARTYVDNLVAEGDQLDIPETVEVSLLSTDEEATEETDEYYPDAIEFIEEYTEPLTLYAGNVVYAFAVDADGNISSISVFQYEYDPDAVDPGVVPNEYEPSDDAPQITMPTINAKPGETVTIPVAIKNNPGLSNLSLVLGYDAENLILEDVANGDVFGDNQFDYETREDGSCKFTWGNASGNDADGTLMSLTFTVEEGATQDDFLLNLNVDYSATVDEETYLVTVPGLIKQNVGILGDVNSDEEVDFSDAIILLKFDAGMINLTGEQLLLGDINEDGDVDFSDAILVLKVDAGMISGF